MKDHNNSEMPISSDQPDYAGKDTGEGTDCGVDEEYFPTMGKCCGMANSTIAITFQEICPHCSVWTSLPNSVSLEVTTIFECSRYGYGKRKKE